MHKIGFSRFGWVAAAALAISTAPSLAETPDVMQAIADEGRSDAARALDASRQPALVLGFSDFEPGEKVADIMGGNGYYSEMIASLVGDDGLVYVANPAAFHDADAWKEVQARHDNIRLLVAAPNALALAPNSLDTIFTHLIFHDLYWESEQYNFPRLDVPAVLANWHAALKSGGTVIIVDHDGPEGDTREIVDKLHRIDRETAIAAMQRAGFTLVEENDALLNDTDDLQKSVFDAEVRGKTSRFVLKFRKS